MNSITSEARYRQRVIGYAEKHGVTAASIRRIIEAGRRYMGGGQNMTVIGRACEIRATAQRAIQTSIQRKKSS